MQNHRIELGLIVFALLVLTLTFSKPGITGFVPTNTHSQNLDIDVSASQRFGLYVSGNASLHSIELSGNVTGPGLVNVYLNDGEQRLLIYSNEHKKKSSMDVVTGLATSDLVVKPENRIDEIQTLPDGYSVSSGSFANTCDATCALSPPRHGPLYLDVIIEPGTTIHISQITFSTSK